MFSPKSIYTAITLFGAFLGISQAIVGFYGAWRASKILHEKVRCLFEEGREPDAFSFTQHDRLTFCIFFLFQMLHSVIRSTPRWFDTTPSGRIVNRFSRDQETIDGQLAQSLRVVATWTAALIGAIIMVSVICVARPFKRSG